MACGDFIRNQINKKPTNSRNILHTLDEAQTLKTTIGNKILYRIARYVVASILLLLVWVMIIWLLDHFSIKRFEDTWTLRLKQVQAPREMAALFKKHGAGDCFQKTYSNGPWIVGVSAASCGEGRLPDMLLIKDGDGGMHKITNSHFCGRNGIVMAIPELESESYQTALNAVEANETKQK